MECPKVRAILFPWTCKRQLQEPSEELAEELIAIWWTPTTILQMVGSKIMQMKPQGQKTSLPKCILPALKCPGSIPELNISCKRQHWDYHSKEPRGGQSGWQMEPSPLYLRNAKRWGWWAEIPKQTRGVSLWLKLINGQRGPALTFIYIAWST